MKMMKIIFLILFPVGLHFAGHTQMESEKETIRNLFFDFLKFYRDHEEKFHSFRLYKGSGRENGPPYRIDWKETNRYFAWLRQSVPFVGEEYIRNERKDFLFYDSCFRANPEEEMPMGFDYDRWLGGQESIEYMLPWYTSPKNKYEVVITGKKARLRIGGELWEGAEEKERGWVVVLFVKEKGKWKMAANVSPDDYEEQQE
jgi:hypothetical protein